MNKQSSNSVFITIENVDSELAPIKLTHFQPSVLSEEILLTGIIVDELPPRPTEIPGKTIKSYWNKSSKKVEYQQVNSVEDPEISSQRAEIQELKRTVADLTEIVLAGGM